MTPNQAGQPIVASAIEGIKESATLIDRQGYEYRVASPFLMTHWSIIPSRTEPIESNHE
jgi:hypothetical protein